MTSDLFTTPETTPLGLRGLHLDPCRHFIEVDTVLRIIDKMAALRLNTLHLHLSDDPSIPVEFACAPQIDSAPRYSIADQERIARACRERGIQVIPELDIPGHARAFLSFVDPAIEPETAMGVITPETIDLERDLPVILAMFGELAERFGARMIHMGGDEAHDYPRFPELIAAVCAWAAARDLEVIAWDDVLSAIDHVPKNLIVHRWRREPDPKIHEARTILSWGYYLDHARDPFTYYNRRLELVVERDTVIGCIACMWTELVTDRTIERTIFPSLYMLAHRWWHYPALETADQPGLLRALCERFGYPPEEPHDEPEWRARRWVGFYRDDPRSTSSVSVHDVLERDHDLVPAFSRELVLAADIISRALHARDPAPSEEERALVLRLGRACYGEDLGFVLAQERGWRRRLKEIMKAAAPSQLFNNGLEAALRGALRSTARA
ncbi:MAG: family 20 glycosylhydrolase [Myxococcales bacterium]|nr:family 20 glycosylhydrolase [Myxococcales bacterium]